MLHGTFIFLEPPAYNWYLSITAILLDASYSLHNVVAWIKNKPFLSRWGSIFYISTVVLGQSILDTRVRHKLVSNVSCLPRPLCRATMLTPACSLYFSGQSRLYVHTQPLEVTLS